MPVTPSLPASTHHLTFEECVARGALQPIAREGAGGVQYERRNREVRKPCAACHGLVQQQREPERHCERRRPVKAQAE
jgi:hypothetical protein